VQVCVKRVPCLGRWLWLLFLRCEFLSFAYIYVLYNFISCNKGKRARSHKEKRNDDDFGSCYLWKVYVGALLFLFFFPFALFSLPGIHHTHALNCLFVFLFFTYFLVALSLLQPPSSSRPLHKTHTSSHSHITPQPPYPSHPHTLSPPPPPRPLGLFPHCLI
jgi:hypothetical protein